MLRPERAGLLLRDDAHDNVLHAAKWPTAMNKQPDEPPVVLLGDPARLASHEVRKVERYRLSVAALPPASSGGAHE